MKNGKSDRKSNRLIIVYGAIAVLFIMCFQVYWLYSLYSNQKKLILEEAENKLTEYRLSNEGIEFVRSMNKSGKLKGNELAYYMSDSTAITHLSIEVISEDGDGKLNAKDSLFSPGYEKNASEKLHKEAVADIKKALPDILFKLYNKKIDTDDGRLITSISRLNPKNASSLVLLNLNYVVVKKIAPYIALSFVYLLVCVSAVVLLINSIRKARRLMEQKVSFTNNMTHELKTPIATLYAATEALDKYNVLEDKKTAREYVQLMQADLKRLKNMADSILHNAKLTDGKLQIHPDKLNLLSLLDDVVFNLRPRLEKQEAEILYNIPDELFIKADEDHIARVFTNLIDNSLKYADAIPRIRITAVKEDKVIKILVTDNGIGIPYKYHKDIFKPYFRVYEGNRHTVKGYGLGLSYVKEVIKLHGGSITLVKDDHLKGTAFEIIILACNE